MTKREYLIFLSGYLQGLAIRTGEPVDPIAIAALKALGCPAKYLPKERT